MTSIPASRVEARLRIPSYAALTNAPAGDDSKDLIFALRCSEIRYDVSDSVLMFPLPFFHGGVIVPLLIVKETITLIGVTYDGGHVAHPYAGAAATHDPDFIDLEEAVVTWGNDAPSQLVHLETEFGSPTGSGGSTFRVYEGVILQAVLVRNAGKFESEFSIQFGVLFDASVRPGLREWSTAP